MRSPTAAQADHTPWNPGGTASTPLPEHSLPEQRPAAERAPGPPPAVWQFPALPVHVRMARNWLEAWIADRGPGEEAAYRAAVAFSELVTNAILHGGAGPVTVRALVGPGRIECEVSDGARDLPVVQEAGEDDEHHRGLSLVQALTTSWQVRLRPEGGKTVTFVVEP
jgi:anti-sigma regulatory factor (Ser/Thr protein kinase)